MLLNNSIISRMEKEDIGLQLKLKEKTFQIYKDFMVRVTKLEELGAVGSRLLSSFKQGLEFLLRPPINQKSELIENIIKANETKRVQSYFEAGCINIQDSVQNMSQLRSSLNGLHKHLSEAKGMVNELESLLKDASNAVQTANESLSLLLDKDFGAGTDVTPDQELTMASPLHKPEMTDFAAMMAIVYSMVKLDYVMQERIVNSLSIKSMSGELESYCLMWSLRPYINDDVMLQAGRLIP